MGKTKHKTYYDRNKDKRKEQSRCRAAKKHLDQQYTSTGSDFVYQERRERARQAEARYRAKNREKLRMKAAERHLRIFLETKGPEAFAERCRRREQLHPERYADSASNMQATRKSRACNPKQPKDYPGIEGSRKHRIRASCRHDTVDDSKDLAADIDAGKEKRKDKLLAYREGRDKWAQARKRLQRTQIEEKEANKFEDCEDGGGEELFDIEDYHYYVQNKVGAWRGDCF